MNDDYIAQGDEYAVVKGDPWVMLFLQAGIHLATRKEFDIYTDRDEAIAAMREHDPDYEYTDNDLWD